MSTKEIQAQLKEIDKEELQILLLDIDDEMSRQSDPKRFSRLFVLSTEVYTELANRI